jgi:hypothetical protein
MAAKGTGKGLSLTSDSYYRITRRGINRNRHAHRVYAGRKLGRTLRMDKEIHHNCGNRSCWPPSDFHLVIMDENLHHARANNCSTQNKSKRQRRIKHGTKGLLTNHAT